MAVEASAAPPPLVPEPGAVSAAVAPARAIGSLARRLEPALFFGPALVLLLCFMFYPLVNGFWLSTQRQVLTRPLDTGFVGLENYQRLIDDALFWLSLTNSVLWVVGSVTLQFTFGLALAVILHQRMAARGLFRAIALAPWAVSGMLTALMWSFMYEAQIGVVNDLLLKMGVIHERVAWLANLDTALAAVIVANVWRGVPFFTISLLAALQTIPPELYEAAAIDGVGTIGRFRYITLPLIKDMIVITTLLRAIWNFNFVDLIYALTGGGPAGHTLTMPVYIFVTAYRSLDFGYGSALAVVLFLVLLVFTVVYFKLSGFGRDEA